MNADVIVPRRILLADADAFFVAVARMVDPDGAGREPLLIVGGTAESRGVVCSASYETRRYGVRSGMPISRALRLCPEAVCVPVPRRACTDMSHGIRETLGKFSPLVEAASIDEWYMDLGGTEVLYDNETLAETAHLIRTAVIRDTGLSVSIGGGTSKLVAKLAVEHAKPKAHNSATGVFVVPPGSEAGFLATLELAEIPMIGPRFQERLASLGMKQVADVLPHSAAELMRMLGEREGEWLWERVRGIHDGAVEPHADAKSLSRDETFAVDIADDAGLAHELASLAQRVSSDLRGEGLAARTITVRIRDHDFRTRSASRTLDAAVMSDRVIHAVARQLLTKLRAARRVPARLLSVALTSLSSHAGADQLALFEAQAGREVETEKDRAVARTIDRVREKFGSEGIVMGGALGRTEENGKGADSHRRRGTQSS
ncbi:MAG: hypothetical protein JWO05_287 [Gemmatimonadetes bacterium]|nr:hypothetical protein [Gemmatimonadota bacterium]